MSTVKKITLPFVVVSMFLLTGCGSLSVFSGESLVDKEGRSLEVTEESYAKDKKNKAVVLFDANWGRHWGCAKYQHARLYRFAFDRLPLEEMSNDAPHDITVANTNGLFVDRRYLSYAMLVAPGEYALTFYTTRISAGKVSDAPARSSAFWGMSPNDFKKIQEPHGGTFKVAAGETVYIGNFSLDCFKEPMIWRYYMKQEYMADHINQYKEKYPFLDLNDVAYRLFDTKIFGRPPSK